jgi:hypothetical protein
MNNQRQRSRSYSSRIGNSLGCLGNLDTVQTPPDGNKIAKKSQSGGEGRPTRNAKPAAKIQPGASLVRIQSSQSVADDALNSSGRCRDFMLRKKVDTPSSSKRLLGRFRKTEEEKRDFLDEANLRQNESGYRRDVGDGREDGSVKYRVASTTPQRKKRRKETAWREGRSMDDEGFEKQNLSGTPGTPSGSPPIRSNFDLNQVMEGSKSPQVLRCDVPGDELSFGTQDELEVKCHNISTTKRRKDVTKTPIIQLCESDMEEDDSQVGNGDGEATCLSILENLGHSRRDIHNSPGLSFSKVNNKKPPSSNSKSQLEKDEIESVSSRDSSGRLMFTRIKKPYRLQDFEEGNHVGQKQGQKRKSPETEPARREASKVGTLGTIFNSCKNSIANVATKVFSPRSSRVERRSQRLRSFARSPRKKGAHSNDVIELSSDEESIGLNDAEQLVDDRNSNMVSDNEMEIGEKSEVDSHERLLKSVYDEDKYSPRRSSRLSNQQIGGRVRCPVSRIGVGSKVFDKGCVLQFQPSSRRQFLRIEYENTSSSETISHDTFLDDEEIKELYFYVPGGFKNSTDDNTEKIEEKGDANANDTPHVSVVDLQHDEGMTQELEPVESHSRDSLGMNTNERSPIKETSETTPKSSPNEKCSQPCYLIMRISPTRENKLAIYSNKYLTDENYPPDKVASQQELKKRFVVAEVHDRFAFLNLLDFMKQNEMLHSLLIGGKITLDLVQEKIMCLQPKPVKQVKTPVASKYKHDDIILVFPFHAKDSELSCASEKLIEADGKLTLSESATFFAKESEDNDPKPGHPQSQRAAKVHTVTIRGEDYDRLCPYEFLNDTLIDFWISW